MQGYPLVLVGLSGRAGAGKDTVAEILRKGHRLLPIAFADALRREIVQSFNLDSAIFDRDQKERRIDGLAITRCSNPTFIAVMAERGIDSHIARSPREIMQWWGTEFRRQQDPDYWVKQASAAIDNARATGHGRIVLTDVRFSNEARLLRRLGGTLWRIHRPRADDAPALHPSESELDSLSPDISIHNDQSLIRLATTTMQAFRACFPRV